MFCHSISVEMLLNVELKSKLTYLYSWYVELDQAKKNPLFKSPVQTISRSIPRIRRFTGRGRVGAPSAHADFESYLFNITAITTKVFTFLKLYRAKLWTNSSLLT